MIENKNEEKENNRIENSTDKMNRYLLFYIGKELYGTPLLDIREVVEYQQPKHMPNMVHYFSGVINIRGAIVGVIDLRLMFDSEIKLEKQTSLLVSDTDQGAIAAIVDKVDSVASISEQEMDKNPPVVSKVKNEYLIGVARVKDQLITVIELKKFLTDENYIKKSA